jgi:hypothetical protein
MHILKAMLDYVLEQLMPSPTLVTKQRDDSVIFHIEGWRGFIRNVYLQTIGQALLLTARPPWRKNQNVVFVVTSSTIISCSCSDHPIK